VVIALGFYFQSWWGLIGVVFVATSSLSFCPLYLPFGLSTNKSGSETKKS
jgi:hypothetical protein